MEELIIKLNTVPFINSDIIRYVINFISRQNDKNKEKFINTIIYAFETDYSKHTIIYADKVSEAFLDFMKKHRTIIPSPIYLIYNYKNKFIDSADSKFKFYLDCLNNLEYLKYSRLIYILFNIELVNIEYS